MRSSPVFSILDTESTLVPWNATCHLGKTACAKALAGALKNYVACMIQTTRGGK